MLLVKRTTNHSSIMLVTIAVSSVDRIVKRLLEQILQLCFQSSSIQRVQSASPVITQTRNKLRPYRCTINAYDYKYRTIVTRPNNHGPGPKLKINSRTKRNFILVRTIEIKSK